MINHIKKILIFSILLIFVLFYFYDLHWSAPFFLHPDERNIASSVSQLNVTRNLNPNFFAYGGLPIYSIYFAGLASNFIQEPFSFENFNVNFEQAIIISRFFSSILTIATLFLIFKIAKDFGTKTTAYTALFLAITSVGYLQYSHFGTFEMWLSSLYLVLFYFFYHFLKRGDLRYFLFGSIVLGAAIAVKVSSAILIFIPLITITYFALQEKKLLDKFKSALILLAVSTIIVSFVYIFTNPYVFIDSGAFLSIMNYESSVALGTLQVFYTGAFYQTVPILFQYTKVLPFLINPLLTMLSLLAIIFVSYLAIKKRNIHLLLLIFTFFVVFLSQSMLFVKWTRYIIPSISFIYIILAIFITKIKVFVPKKIWNISLIIAISFSLLFSFAFIKTVRLSTDSRLHAAEFANQNINSNDRVLSEIYDLGIIPFNDYLKDITLFNLYDLDADSRKKNELINLIENSSYIIIPSQRILKSRIEKENLFPVGNKFYSDLLNEKTEFTKIYETPCDIFCKIVYLGNPIYNVEETVNIFDRPTILIFKNRSL